MKSNVFYFEAIIECDEQQQIDKVNNLLTTKCYPKVMVLGYDLSTKKSRSKTTPGVKVNKLTFTLASMYESLAIRKFLESSGTILKVKSFRTRSIPGAEVGIIREFIEINDLIIRELLVTHSTSADDVDESEEESCPMSDSEVSDHD